MGERCRRGHFDMICGSGKLAAEVKLCGKQQNKWDLVRKRQFFGKRLVVATNRKVEVVLNVDRRGQHGLGLQDLEDVQVPPAHGRWKGEKNVHMKFFEFLFKAKVILGFTASVGLEEMSIELIHQKFMAKLQLVTASEMLIYFNSNCRAKTQLDECQNDTSRFDIVNYCS